MIKKIVNINVSAAQPYVIEWDSANGKIEEYQPVLPAINFYEDDKEEDIEIEPTGSELTFNIKHAEEPNHYSITFSGTLELDLSETTWAQLDGVDYSVDYFLQFESPDGKTLESGEDFELVENSNVQIEVA